MKTIWLVVIAVAAACCLATAPARGPASAEARAIDPPPISLRVDKVTIADLAAALSKATQAPVKLGGMESGGMEMGGSFTLDVRDKPFWEVMLALNTQSPLQMISGQNFCFSYYGGIRGGVVSQGFYVFPNAILRTQQADSQIVKGPQVQPEVMKLFINIASDPRICVVAMKPPRLLSAIDDAGNNLREEDRAEQRWEPGTGHFWDMQANLKIPAKMGGKIASLKGAQTLLVGVGEKRFEVADVTKMTQPLELSRQKVTVRSERGLFIIKAEAKVPEAKGPEQYALPLTIRLVDGKGVEKWLCAITTGEATAAEGRIMYQPLVYEGALKMIVAEPAAYKEVEMGFEIKDLELPRWSW